MKLSKSLVDKLRYEGRELSPGKFTQDIRWDDSVPAFGVRIYPNQTKAFVISYRFRGQQRIRSLGKYGRITFDQAKKDAKVKLAAASQGSDPFYERDKNNRGRTFAEVAEEHLIFHSQLPPEKRKRTLHE